MKQFEDRPMRDIQDEEPPVAGLAALKQDRAPSRDLWPGIDSRIRARQIRRQRTPWLAAVGLAASLVLVLGATVGINELRPKARPLAAPVGESLAAAGDPALLPASNRMHPETRALVKANLKIVNSAESDLKRAIAADPDDAYLRSLLASAQQQKEQLHIVLADAR
jgi:hypothetical protein